jgi:hypothetical protein
MSNPLRSEGAAFRLLVWTVVVAVAIIGLALLARAII